MSGPRDADLADRLAGFFDGLGGVTGHRVEDLRRLSGGASREDVRLRPGRARPPRARPGR